MKKPTLLSLLMVLIAAPVWADMADDLVDVTAGLKSLVEPMEKKLDDCDEQVSEAEEALKETKSKVGKVLAVRDKLWQNIDRLRNSLLKQASKIEIEGELFCREAVAQTLENLLEKYEANDEILTQLQGQEVAQKSRLQESIAKQQRWRAKENVLLQKIAKLEEARRDPSSDGSSSVSPSAVEEAANLEVDIKNMLEAAKGSKAKQVPPPRQEDVSRNAPRTQRPSSVRKSVGVDIDIDMEQATATGVKSSSHRPQIIDIDIDGQNANTVPPANSKQTRPVSSSGGASARTERPAKQAFIPLQPESPASSSGAKGSIVRQNGPTMHRPTSHTSQRPSTSYGPLHSSSPGLLEIDVDQVGGEWDGLDFNP